MSKRVVSIPLGSDSYSVMIGEGVLAALPDFLTGIDTSARVALIVDQGVQRPWGEELFESLLQAGFNPLLIPFEAREETKTLTSVAEFYRQLLSHKIDRKGAVVALGGGIVGDTAGFAAATYLRGVSFIQCPTTLLSMVDASVGGKTGVNLPEGKNLVGALHQPRLVLADTRCLKTLPERDYRCGLAECVKHGLGSESIFHFLETHVEGIRERDTDTLASFIESNVSFKGSIVSQDEKELGVRAILNLGHTFAHAIESSTKYQTFLHGEAVALGIVAALQISLRLDRIDPEVAERTKTLLRAFSLPISAPLPSIAELRAAMEADKKSERGVLRLVVPERNFRLSVIDAPEETVLTQAWLSIGGTERSA